MGNIEIMNKLFNILKQSINKNLLVKGKVNDKKFSYDEKGHKEAISYATKLMQSKKPVNFKWHEENYAEKDLKKADGSPIKAGGDTAFMYPMLEMAGPYRSVYIPYYMYVYNIETLVFVF